VYAISQATGKKATATAEEGRRIYFKFGI